MRTKIIKIVFPLIIVGLLIFFGISYIKKTGIYPPTFEETNWSNPINISRIPPPASSEEWKEIYPESPILTVDDNDILHAVWAEQSSEGIKETLGLEVWDWRFNVKEYLSYSFNKDGVWSEPTQLFSFSQIQPYYITEDKNFSKLALVSDKKDTLYLIWSLTETKSEVVERGKTPTTRAVISAKDINVFYSQKLKDGEWSEPEKIFNPQEEGQNQISQILLAVDSDYQPHIICRLPDYSIYQITKDKNNNWFSSPQTFKTQGGVVARPKYLWLTIDNNDTWHLVWSEKENRMYYALKPKGKDWQMPVEISQGKELHLGSFFSAALDKKGGLHFAWRDAKAQGPNPIIYAFKLKNEALSELVYLIEDSHDFSGYEWGVRLTLNGNNFPHVIWIGEDTQIMYINKIKGGGWSESVAISNNLGRINREPYLMGSEEALHLVFMSGEWTYGNIFYNFKPLK